jgi:uncharacterized protein (TIRG00374 family)
MVLKKILNIIIKVFLPLILGCALLWYLYRDIDFGEIWQIIKTSVRYDILLFSLLFGLIANIIRAYRWGLLINTLGEKFKMKNLVYAVLGNYALNFVFPRVGEVWRCGIITKYEKISFTKLLGTLLIDRVADTLSVALLTMFIVIFHFGFFKMFLANNPQLAISFPDGWLIISILIVIVVVWLIFTRLSHLSLVQKVKDMLLSIWEGMKSVWLMDRKRLFILQTILIWGFYFLYFYITFYAFNFTSSLGVSLGLVAFVMGSISVAAPIQGGIGAWHFIVIATLVCFGVKETDAAAFALVVHSVQSIWMASCGIFGIVALPFSNKEPKKD